VFHVQTEDSGIANPRIFTHLFHEGVIIATKKLDYDANSDADVVKSLMQAQHKAVLRELKDGHLDAKIDRLLGGPAGRAPSPEVVLDELPDLVIENDEESEYAQIIVDNPGASLVAGTLEQTEDEEDEIDVSGAFRRIATPGAADTRRAVTPNPVTVAPARPAGGSSAPRPAPGQWILTRTGQQERPFEKSGPVPVPPQPAPAAPPPIPPSARTQPSKRVATPVKLPEVPTPPPPPFVHRRRPSGTSPAAPPVPVDVRRPSAPTPAGGSSSAPPSRASTAPVLPVVPPAPRVASAAPVQPRTRPMDSIVVARPAVVIGAPAPERKPARESTPPPESIFGQDLISEKSLDEVIMAYLSEDANDD
jgi:hypothetical protein